MILCVDALLRERPSERADSLRGDQGLVDGRCRLCCAADQLVVADERYVARRSGSLD